MDFIASLLGAWSTELSGFTVLFRLLLSFALSACIGCERASKRHAAGLRTFIVVSLAFTVAALIDAWLIETYALAFYGVSAGAVIGSAIIGANSILFSSKNQIKGLTTSVALWMCGLLGLAVGAGLYTVAVVGFSVLIVSLSFFPSLEIFLKNRSNHFEIYLELVNKTSFCEFTATVRKLGLRIDDVELNPAYVGSGLSVYTVAITVVSDELKKYKTHAEIIEALKTLEYVNHIEEMN